MSLDHLPGTTSILELPRMLADPIGFLEQRRRLYGNVWKTRIGVPAVLLLGPEANKSVMVTSRDCFSHKRGYGVTALAALFDGSLLFVDGDEHRRERGILQPAMARVGLEDSLRPMQAAWARAARDLGDGRVVDLYAFMQRVTFEVSASILMGLNLQQDLDQAFPLFETMIQGALAFTRLRIPFGKLDRGLRAREQLIRLLIPRVEEMRQRPPIGMAGRLAHHREPDGTQLSAKRVVEHLLLLFWAGYDTTASMGSWTLHQLADLPAWQERLLAEQRAVCADRVPTLDECNELSSLHHFLLEIERFRPVTLFAARMTTQDVMVEGKRVPADTLIFYSPYATHRMESVFPRADVFDPDRWARGAPTQALVGFGGGPRICLGKAFALLQLRVMLTTLLPSFRLERDPQRAFRPVLLPTYRPENSCARFQPRDPGASR